jgi:pyruvate ferredoxin oxidoreductase gamma subunit
MYRIRFHGRGGHGIKTASRMLGTAFFLEGYEVQDAPVYGAERRGAPISAYVRADAAPIDERGAIARPDLIVVVDDTLMGLAVPQGRASLAAGGMLLVHSVTTAAKWADWLRLPEARVVGVVEQGQGMDGGLRPQPGVRCAGAAARLVGVIGRAALERAVRDELAGMPAASVASNVALALGAFDEAAPFEGLVVPTPELPIGGFGSPQWIELPLDPPGLATATITGRATSLANPTGTWRTIRPVLDAGKCKHCWWLCTSFCPDSVMAVGSDGTPEIDLVYCKGCMLCMAQCPHHAIESELEADWRAPAAGGAI